EAGPLYGGGALLAFAALAALTALSVIWSFQPSDSWLEASRTFAYLATFAAGVSLVRLIPWGWAGLLHGVAGACVIVSAWALLTKILPGSGGPGGVSAPPARAVGLLERGRPDGRARRPAADVAGRAALRPRRGERARLAGAGPAARLHDAVLLARRA